MNIRYAALLRGVNVGGNATVKMAELASSLGDLGLTNVKTFLNSGNVLFDSDGTDEAKLIEKIEQQLESKFGRKIQVLLRTQEYLKQIEGKKPYASYDQSDKSLYFLAVFFAEKLKHEFTLPHKDPSIGLTIADISEREVYLVLDRKLLATTGDAMKFISKEFPGLSTSRTWTTVTKLVTL